MMPGENMVVSITLRALDMASPIIGHVDGEVRRLGTGIGTISSGAGMAAAGLGLIGAAATTGLVMAAKSAAETGAQLYHLHERTGLSVEALSRLNYAAGQTGTDLGAVEMGLRRLAVASNAMPGSTTPGTKALKELGIEVEGAAWKSMDAEHRFLAVGQALRGVDDDSRRSALAIEIFGRSGTRLIPMFTDADRSINDFGADAERLGVTLDTETARKLTAFNDKLKDLEATGKKAFLDLGVAVMPVLKEIAEAVTPLVHDLSQWIEKNPELAKGIGEVALAAGTLLAILAPLVLMAGVLSGPVGWVALGASVAAGIGAYELLKSKAPQHRQHGGGVGGVDAYIVGEEGPEIAVFGRPGYILPNEVFRSLEHRQGGGFVSPASAIFGEGGPAPLWQGLAQRDPSFPAGETLTERAPSAMEDFDLGAAMRGEGAAAEAMPLGGKMALGGLRRGLGGAQAVMGIRQSYLQQLQHGEGADSDLAAFGATVAGGFTAGTGNMSANPATWVPGAVGALGAGLGWMGGAVAGSIGYTGNLRRQTEERQRSVGGRLEMLARMTPEMRRWYLEGPPRPGGVAEIGQIGGYKQGNDWGDQSRFSNWGQARGGPIMGDSGAGTEYIEGVRAAGARAAAPQQGWSSRPHTAEEVAGRGGGFNADTLAQFARMVPEIAARQRRGRGASPPDPLSSIAASELAASQEEGERTRTRQVASLRGGGGGGTYQTFNFNSPVWGEGAMRELAREVFFEEMRNHSFDGYAVDGAVVASS